MPIIRDTKTRKSNLNIKLKWQNTVTMDIEELNKFNKEELKNIVKELARVAKSRATYALHRFQEENLPTPSVYHKYEVYKINDENIGSLRHDYVELSRFLLSKTSTYTGWKQTLNQFVKRVEKKSGIEITDDYYNKFWDIYKELIRDTNIGKLMINQGQSDEIQRSIAEEMEQNDIRSVDDLVKVMEETLQQEYIDENKNEVRKIKNGKSKYNLDLDG